MTNYIIFLKKMNMDFNFNFLKNKFGDEAISDLSG